MANIEPSQPSSAGTGPVDPEIESGTASRQWQAALTQLAPRPVAPSAPLPPGERRALDIPSLTQEMLATFDRVQANPVTPCVHNAGFRETVLQYQQRQNQKVAVLLADSNDFARYNEATSPAQGDVAIAETSKVFNQAAHYLNERLYPETGFWCMALREGGDEFAILGVQDPGWSPPETPPPSDAPPPIRYYPTPPTDRALLQTMIRVLGDEGACYNAGNEMPNPTLTAAAAFVRPGDHANSFELRARLDQIDHAGPQQLNTLGASPWFRNGGVVVDDGLDDKGLRVIHGLQVMPGPIYQLPPDAQLREFRQSQGGLPDPERAYEDGMANVVSVLPATPSARPQLIPQPPPPPGQPPPPPRERAGLPAALLHGMAGLDAADPETRLAELRRQEPIDSQFRPLLDQGVRVYNQPAGMSRMQYMLDQASRDGGSTALEFFEPRGMAQLNKHGVVGEEVKVNGADVPVSPDDDKAATEAPKALKVDGADVPVSHGGGNAVMEALVLANDQALTEVLGTDYDDRGAAFTFRDRSKRLANVYGPEVDTDTIRQVDRRRGEIYREMPATIMIGSEPHPMLMPTGAGTVRPFSHNAAAATIRVTAPGRQAASFQAGSLQADSLRELLVGPSSPDGRSILDLAKMAVDHQIVPPQCLPAPVPGREIFFSDSSRLPPAPG